MIQQTAQEHQRGYQMRHQEWKQQVRVKGLDESGKKLSPKERLQEMGKAVFERMANSSRKERRAIQADIKRRIRKRRDKRLQMQPKQKPGSATSEK